MDKFIYYPDQTNRSYKMKIELVRLDDKFQFKSGEGDDAVYLSASEKLQGENGKGQRPMQLILQALAGCMSIDVLNILYKQKQDVQDYNVSVSGDRSEELPGVFTNIKMTIHVKGAVKEEFLKRAIKLGEEKYCSVHHMLNPTVDIVTDYKLNEA
ncbi:MAG: OsmC family protein [Flavobacteriales bacterium]|nr:OsmC family protein [Flavobacteriales bacterium]